MAPTKKRKPTRAGGSKPRAGKAKPKPSKKGSGGGGSGEGFPQALGALLRARRIPVPAGLEEAPPEAYAREPASLVDELAALPDDDLRRFADRIASYAERQAERARREWDASPLIAELRRRGLEEPSRPRRAAGVSVSLTKPLGEWTDAEIVRAARDWSRRAGG